RPRGQIGQPPAPCRLLRRIALVRVQIDAQHVTVPQPAIQIDQFPIGEHLSSPPLTRPPAEPPHPPPRRPPPRAARPSPSRCRPASRLPSPARGESPLAGGTAPAPAPSPAAAPRRSPAS